MTRLVSRPFETKMVSIPVSRLVSTPKCHTLHTSATNVRLDSTIHAIRIMNWTARWAIYAILHVTAVLNSAPFWLWADLLSSRFWNFNMIELKIVTSLLLSPSDSGLSSKCRAISACSTLVGVVEVNSSFKDVNRLWSPLKNNGAKFRCLRKLLNLHTYIG